MNEDRRRLYTTIPASASPSASLSCSLSSAMASNNISISNSEHDGGRLFLLSSSHKVGGKATMSNDRMSFNSRSKSEGSVMKDVSTKLSSPESSLWEALRFEGVTNVSCGLLNSQHSRQSQQSQQSKQSKHSTMSTSSSKTSQTSQISRHTSTKTATLKSSTSPIVLSKKNRSSYSYSLRKSAQLLPPLSFDNEIGGLGGAAHCNDFEDESIFYLNSFNNINNINNINTTNNTSTTKNTSNVSQIDNQEPRDLSIYIPNSIRPNVHDDPALDTTGNDGEELLYRSSCENADSTESTMVTFHSNKKMKRVRFLSDGTQPSRTLCESYSSTSRSNNRMNIIRQSIFTFEDSQHDSRTAPNTCNHNNKLQNRVYNLTDDVEDEIEKHPRFFIHNKRFRDSWLYGETKRNTTYSSDSKSTLKDASCNDDGICNGCGLNQKLIKFYERRHYRRMWKTTKQAVVATLSAALQLESSSHPSPDPPNNNITVNSQTIEEFCNLFQSSESLASYPSKPSDILDRWVQSDFRGLECAVVLLSLLYDGNISGIVQDNGTKIHDTLSVNKLNDARKRPEARMNTTLAHQLALADAKLVQSFYEENFNQE